MRNIITADEITLEFITGYTQFPIDGKQYHILSGLIAKSRHDAFLKGVILAREANCKAMCEFCANGDRIEYLEGDVHHPSGWIHITRVGRTWCNAGAIRNQSIPKMEE